MEEAVRAGVPAASGSFLEELFSGGLPAQDLSFHWTLWL
jgi:hypothetical protein